MMQTMWATVRAGQIQLSEHVDIPDGTRLLVTIVPEEEKQFWQDASQSSLAAVWANAQDDAYAQLLKE